MLGALSVELCELTDVCVRRAHLPVMGFVRPSTQQTPSYAYVVCAHPTRVTALLILTHDP